ncbi:MAG TPA: threonine synthase [Gemmatimonadales bacterium]|nr:threonine synthase [Gemmatimonadales bacterium]
MMDWRLECAACGATRGPEGLPTVCDRCGQPWLVRYPDRDWTKTQRDSAAPGVGMWRWRAFLPILDGEAAVTLGEGDTPLMALPRWAARAGLPRLLLKDEGVNPTGSFKSRGLSAAITRAAAAGVTRVTIPTAGNAGVAAAAYAARAGLRARVFAPDTTPRRLLSQVVSFGGELVQLRGHIGDCGKASRQWAAESGALDLSTLREPYRIEGKKTLGLELALQFGWRLPSAILYPAGGGTGLIGMWKAFGELRAAGWLAGPLPRMFAVQSTGCAPIVRAFEAGAATAEPWQDPWTVASGLRVPAPLGDRLMLAALRESGGGAEAVADERLQAVTAEVTALEGVDLSPEGGAVLAVAEALAARGVLSGEETVVAFNTGAGWLYRGDGDLPAA